MKKKGGDTFVPNLVAADPLVWTERAGYMKAPYPNNWIVLIALERLDLQNGLPVLEGCSKLECGEYAILSGDEDMRLGDKGGGLAFLMRLEK